MMKRVFDVLVAALLLVLLSPVLLVVALIVLGALGRPVLFRQERPGLHGIPFTICKFRTMRAPLREGGELEDEEVRLTRAGRILRQTSLDELPELINVVKGDMSLVGPRPLLSIYLDRYSAEQARRHDVRPGITGLAQVRGRNSMTWERKFELDVQYVDQHNIRMDLMILLKTVWQVIRRDGITEIGAVTASEFRGSAAGSPAAE